MINRFSPDITCGIQQVMSNFNAKIESRLWPWAYRVSNTIELSPTKQSHPRHGYLGVLVERFRVMVSIDLYAPILLQVEGKALLLLRTSRRITSFGHPLQVYGNENYVCSTGVHAMPEWGGGECFAVINVHFLRSAVMPT